MKVSSGVDLDLFLSLVSKNIFLDSNPWRGAGWPAFSTGLYSLIQLAADPKARRLHARRHR